MAFWFGAIWVHFGEQKGPKSGIQSTREFHRVTRPVSRPFSRPKCHTALSDETGLETIFETKMYMQDRQDFIDNYM